MRFALSLSAAALLLTANIPSAHACTQRAANSYSKYIAAEHAKRRSVRGIFRVVKIEKLRHDEEFGDVRQVYGQITARSGKTIETVHTSDGLQVMCGRPEGPDMNATGTFFLEKNQKDDRYEIFDWRGDYLPPSAKLTNESGS